MCHNGHLYKMPKEGGEEVMDSSEGIREVSIEEKQI